MTYETLLEKAEQQHLTVNELDMAQFDGLIIGKDIFLRSTINTQKQKACVLAEEIGHALTSAGNILDYNVQNNWRQEVKARTVGYELMVGLDDIVEAFNSGCRNRYELAEYLGVTEKYLQEAVERYHEKYGVYVNKGNYCVMFEPCLTVIKKIER